MKNLIADRATCERVQALLDRAYGPYPKPPDNIGRVIAQRLGITRDINTTAKRNGEPVGWIKHKRDVLPEGDDFRIDVSPLADDAEEPDRQRRQQIRAAVIRAIATLSADEQQEARDYVKQQEQQSRVASDRGGARRD